MGKKDKRNNQKNNNYEPQEKETKQEVLRPEIIVNTESEKNNIEEMLNKADKYYSSKIGEGDSYFELKKNEADEYYSKKLEEADSFKEELELEKEQEVERAVNKIKKDMSDEIENAKKEADDILEKAKLEALDITKELEEKKSKILESEEEVLNKIADLEHSKEEYKKEILNKIQDQLKDVVTQKENLENELNLVKESIKKKDRDIKALGEDKLYYEKELSENSIKRSEILNLKKKCEDLELELKSINEIYKNLLQENKNLKSKILLYGDDPSKAIRENESLTKENAKLQTLLRDFPSVDELDNLRENNKKFEELKNKFEILKNEKFRLETENIELKLNKDEIESYRQFVKILEVQKAELQAELNRNIELYNNTAEKVFSTLSLIDDKKCNVYAPIVKEQGITLKSLCEKFRGYLMNRKDPLYYDEKTIRTFIAGFASARLMILEGLSGTGKSSLPKAFADFMGSQTKIISVQSSWKDRNDLLGFYNDFKKQYKETEFLKALYTATRDHENIYIIVLDEMNLSRIEYYFADLLSVLEGKVEEWKIELISDFASVTKNKDAWPKLINEGKLQISDNTWFVGTANKDDSTFMITDKVYDRSVVINFEKKGKYEKIANASPIKMSNADFQLLLEQAAKSIKSADETKYKEMVDFLDEKIKKYFQITFGNRIGNQLEKFVPVYINCGGTVDEAIDVMFSRKILRKLEGMYDESTKKSLEKLWEDIEKKYNMPMTIEAITRMIDKI